MSRPTLYLVSTPIGNLSDFSSHAQSVLSQVDFILCEDTRHSLKLLNHFGIKSHLESLHLHNEQGRAHAIVEKILHSKNQCAALISDAGTPAICDPGSYLVAAAHEQGVQVIVVPGPSSFPSAIAASGFIQPRTIFSGFLSKSSKDQFSEFKLWVAASPCLAVFFESPKRLKQSLENLSKFFSENKDKYELNSLEVCVSREISKKFEEHRRGTLASLLTEYDSVENLQGEFVVCVNLNKVEDQQNKVTLEFAANEACLYSQVHQVPLKKSCKEIAEKYGFSSKEIYGIASKKA